MDATAWPVGLSKPATPHATLGGTSLAAAHIMSIRPALSTLAIVAALTTGATAETFNGSPVELPDEIITLEDLRRPPVEPKPRLGARALATPPYSDRAILSDAWTRAWLLLDVDATGRVERLKIMNAPGFDLEPIAIAEGFRVRFDPARDGDGRPTRTYVIWPIEWPAQSWLRTHLGITTRMPSTDPASRTSAARVPCRGRGPWNLGATYHGYRDCSRPNFDAAVTAPWILPG